MKRCTASSAKLTSIGVSAAGSAIVAGPGPGAATKKSSRWSSPPAVWTSMKPPAPGPVSGDSATNDMSTRGHGGVDGVAALAQHVGAGLGGERMAGCDDPFHGRA